MIAEHKKGVVFFTNQTITNQLPKVNNLRVDPITRTIKFQKKNDSAEIYERLWEFIGNERKEVTEGTTIRFGKQVLTLKKLNLTVSQEQAQKLELNDYLSEKSGDIFDNPELQKEGLECRICFDVASEEDPFANLCQCSKSMPVHLNCVRRWMQQKCRKGDKNGNLTWFKLADVRCDICGDDYPYNVDLRGVSVPIFDATVDGGKKYALFEVYELGTSKVKAVLVLYADGSISTFRIGRAATNEITFDDISISRKHAQFAFTKDKLYLKDLGSKFGSHIEHNEIKAPIDQRRLKLQVGKFYFKIHFFFGKKCFCRSESKYKYIKNPEIGLNELKNEFGAWVKKKSNKVMAIERIDQTRIDLDNRVEEEKPEEKFDAERLAVIKEEIEELKKEAYIKRKKLRMAISKSALLNRNIEKSTVNNRPVTAFRTVAPKEGFNEVVKVEFAKLNKNIGNSNETYNEENINRENEKDEYNIEIKEEEENEVIKEESNESFREMESQENEDNLYSNRNQFGNPSNQYSKSKKQRPLSNISHMYRNYVSNLIVHKKSINESSFQKIEEGLKENPKKDSDLIDLLAEDNSFSLEHQDKPVYHDQLINK